MSFTKQSFVTLSVSDGQTSGGLTASLSETSAGTDWEVRPVTVTTSWVAIPLGGLASFDLIAVKNTDALHFVQISTDGAGAAIPIKLIAGRFCFLPVDPSATLYWKADTANCVCQLAAVEP